MDTLPIYPKFYYCRGKVSDLKWILTRMSCIPENKRAEVALEYQTIYLSKKNGRKDANEYLNGLAKEYRDRANGKQQKKV